MLVKFNDSGSGDAKGAIDYLMGLIDHKGDERSIAPRVLDGNPETFLDIVRSIDPTQAQFYTSGTLCFEEENIKEEYKYQIMQSFEETLFPGLDKSQYSIVWVEHRDKDKLELNFVTAETELHSGKRLQTYWQGADMRRVDDFKTVTNYDYGFSDPNDPLKSRLIQIGKEKNPVKIAKMTSLARKALESGVSNRKEIVDFFNSLDDVEVSRTTKNNISLKVKGFGTIRMTGPMFKQDFQGEKAFIEYKKTEREKYLSNIDEYVKERRIALEKYNDKRAEENRQKYPNKNMQSELDPLTPPELVIQDLPLVDPDEYQNNNNKREITNDTIREQVAELARNAREADRQIDSGSRSTEGAISEARETAAEHKRVRSELIQKVNSSLSSNIKQSRREISRTIQSARNFYGAISQFTQFTSELRSKLGRISDFVKEATGRINKKIKDRIGWNDRNKDFRRNEKFQDPSDDYSP